MGIDHHARNEFGGPGTGHIGNRVGSRGSGEYLAIGEADDTNIIVLRRYSDGADTKVSVLIGSVAAKQSLADRGHGGAAIGGAIETVGAKIHRVGISRTQSYGSIKKNSIRTIEAVGRNPRLRWTPKQRPRALAGAGDVGYASQNDLRRGGVEVGVIHSHARRIHAVLINRRITAVAKVGPGPRAIGLQEFGAIVLGAADAEVCIRRVHGQAYELRGI